MSEPEAVAGLRKIRAYLLESISQAADEISMIDDRLSSLLEGRRSSMKGKSRIRNARTDLMRCNAANARRRARNIIIKRLASGEEYSGIVRDFPGAKCFCQFLSICQCVGAGVTTNFNDMEYINDRE
jgi:hypothetical protein